MVFIPKVFYLLIQPMNRKPYISIIMSVNRDDGSLYKTIDSILNQTYENYEFLIINDGGMDCVRNTISKYFDKRIKYFERSNIGITACLNYGISKASGSYFSRQDAGDVSKKNRLDIQMNYLENNCEIGLVGTWISEFSENGEHLGEIEFPTNSDDIIQKILFQNPFCHGSIMSPMHIIKEFSGYREGFVNAQDLDLWLRIIQKYKVANINQVLYTRIVSRDSISIRKKSIQLEYAKIARKCYYFRKTDKKEPLDLLDTIKVKGTYFKKKTEKKMNSNYYFYCGRVCFSKRKMIKSRKYFLKSIYHDPIKLINIPYYFSSFLPYRFINILESYLKLLSKRIKLYI